jgi:hypothetical protein
LVGKKPMFTAMARQKGLSSNYPIKNIYRL